MLIEKAVSTQRLSFEKYLLLQMNKLRETWYISFYFLSQLVL